MSELKLNAIRLNTLSLNTMPINCVGFKKKASSSAPGDVDENGYIIFADPEVARICAENWGDKTGITKEQAAAVTSLAYKFKAKAITSFDELRFFTGLRKLEGTLSGTNGQFAGCSSLTSIILPPQIEEVGIYCFLGCTSLSSCELPQTITSVGAGAFNNTPALDIDVYLPNLESLGSVAFKSSGIRSFNVSSAPLTTIAGAYAQSSGTFYGSGITYAILSEAISSIGIISFAYCDKLEALICKAIVPPTLGADAFLKCSILKVYVPDGTTTDAEGNTITIAEAYKAATNWSTYAARIFPISQLATDNPELYAEIEEYL